MAEPILKLKNANIYQGESLILSDVNITVNAICANKIDERVIKVIKKNEIEYIEENIQTDRVLHAEMKVIERIFAERIFSNILCIGIAKLPCAPC